MAFNTSQQAAFTRRIDQMKEDGFFLPTPRHLSGDTRYLIVSFGGTGADGLFGIKKQFEAMLPAADLEKRVRFLGIDTDPATQKHTKEIRREDGSPDIISLDTLTNDQFFPLQGSPARLVVASDTNITEWINPQLRQRILNKPDELLNGNGASGVRQVGRLSLYPEQNVKGLTAKITKLVGELTHGNHHPLRVFIISGIAGGTGSGSVVDLTYLIRNIIENMPGDLDSPEANVPTRTSYCGFILLPPTGTSTDPTYIERGNRNGYAALKEINYLMTIDYRSGGYSLTYGDGRTVESHKKIFDACYLLDGISDGVVHESAHDTAINVLSRCVLDMVTASQAQSNGTRIQAVDSFMNDQSATRIGMVAGKPIAHAMRDADYVYCALGHSEFAMPANEIKAYVANKMFEKIHLLFKNCSNVQPEDAFELLKRIIQRGSGSESSIRNTMDAELDTIFSNIAAKKGGPFYAINLLKKLSEQVTVQLNKARVARIGGPFNGVDDQTLNYIQRYALKCNNETFEVYTEVLDALKDLFADQYGAVVKTEKSSTTYSFIPLDLGTVDGTQHIIKYLDGLVNSTHLSNLMNAMLKEMAANRTEWLDLLQTSGASAAPAAMRRFWNRELDKLVNTSMENFLIKYFLGDPDAFYDAENPTKEQEEKLTEAAEAIYQQMLGVGGSAQPMVEITPMGLSSDNFNGHTYLLVPESAPHLYEKLKSKAAEAPAGNQVQVCTSLSADRISCYKQYTSIPAFKLAWACRAEADYEKGLVTPAGIGVHMSETSGGNQWRDFPNLLPKSSWKMVPKSNYFNAREAKLADRAASLFDKSAKLDLTTGRQAVAGTPNLTYTVKVLPVEFRPDDALFREMDRCLEDSAELRMKLAAIDESAERCANALFAKINNWTSAANIPITLEDAGVALKERELFYPDSILTVGPADKKPEGWDEYMAQCMLRKMPAVINEVNGTVMVMEKLHAMVTKSVQANSMIKVFAQYLVTDMFSYDAATHQWQYRDANGFPVQLAFIATDLEKMTERYIMFKAFRENYDAIINATSPVFFTKVPSVGATDRLAKIQSFMMQAGACRDQLSAWLMNPPVAPYAQVLTAMGYDINAIHAFHHALFEEFKFMALAGYVPVLVEKTTASIPTTPVKYTF